MTAALALKQTLLERPIVTIHSHVTAFARIRVDYAILIDPVHDCPTEACLIPVPHSHNHVPSPLSSRGYRFQLEFKSSVHL